MTIPEKNTEHVVSIEGYTSEGSGVCRVGGRAVFVPKTIKGERWKIKILKSTSTAVYARGMELLEPSPERIDPSCPYYGLCGGCSTRHMTYSAELSFKLEKVNDALRRVGKQTVMASRITGSDKTRRYRNKAVFNIADVNGVPSYGFFRERSHDLICTSRCLIQMEPAELAAAAVCGFMAENGFPSFSEETGKGYTRHVFTRCGCHSGEILVCVSSYRGFGGKTDLLVEYIKKALPNVTGIVLNINKERYNTVLSGEFYTLFGKDHLTDTLCGHLFNLSPRAFYQINPPQAERLYAKAVEYACAGETDSALELYCGAGTISMCLAERFNRVLAAEIVPEAIENAKQNAINNKIDNITFICADAGDLAQRALATNEHPDAIVVDPPRKGMSPEAVEATAKIGAERIVYVSCDPATLSRDILLFNSFGYELHQAESFDLFPRTKHCESVALLQRRIQFTAQPNQIN